MSKYKITPHEIDYLIMLVDWYDSTYNIDYAIQMGRCNKQVIDALELAHEKNTLIIEKLKRLK